MKQLAKISIALDKRREFEGGTYRVTVRINRLGQRKYFPIDEDRYTQKEFDAVMESQRGALKSKFEEWDNEKDEAKAIVKELGSSFTWNVFSLRFANRSTDKSELFRDWIAFADESDHVIGSINLFREFMPKARYDALNEDTFHEFKKWLEITPYHISPDGVEKFRTVSTVSGKLRDLRLVVYKAVRKGKMTHEQHPFAKNEKRFDAIDMPVTRNKKKALDAEDLAKMMNEHSGLPPAQDYARAYWVLLCLMGGLQNKDVLHMQKTDFVDREFTFIRRKTEGAKRIDEKIVVAVDEGSYLEQLIKRFASKDPNSPYFFEFMEDVLESVGEPRNTLITVNHPRENRLRENFSKKMVRRLKLVKRNLGIESSLDNSKARNSAASIMIAMGWTIEQTKEQMGHTDIKTTQGYIKDLANKKRSVSADVQAYLDALADDDTKTASM